MGRYQFCIHKIAEEAERQVRIQEDDDDGDDCDNGEKEEKGGKCS